MSAPIDVGDPAPPFTLPTGGGGEVSLSDFAGNTVVIYFYPRDNTPGCTKEAIGFSEARDDFAAAGAKILGVSKDSPASHDKFTAKHDLRIPLASDETGAMIESYGAWVQKSNYGRSYMGIDRSTFVVDGEGIIRAVWRKVRVKDHVAKVLDAVKAL